MVLIIHATPLCTSKTIVIADPNILNPNQKEAISEMLNNSPMVKTMGRLLKEL
jgi:hypothetical protein